MLRHGEPALLHPSLRPGSAQCLCAWLGAFLTLQAHGTRQGAASHGVRLCAWKLNTKAEVGKLRIFTREELYFVAVF